MGLLLILKLFGETEISQVQVTISIDKDILRLEVSVENFLIVQKFYGYDKLCDKRNSLVLWKFLFLIHQSGQSAIRNILKGQIDVLMGLKSVVKGDDVGTVFGFHKGVKFSQGVFHLAFVKQFILVHLLESHFFTIFRSQVNGRKTARIYFVGYLEGSQL